MTLELSTVDRSIRKEAVTGSGSFDVAILLGRGMPLGEQKRTLAELGEALIARGLTSRTEIAFAEMSDPPLEAVLAKLRDEGVRSCVILPVIVPFDRNLKGWIGRWLSRWSSDTAGEMRVVLADPVDGTPALLAPIIATLEKARPALDVRDAIKPLKIKAGASRIPDVSRVALVCLGPRCAQAGGFEIYDKLRRRFGPHKPDDLNEDPLLCLRTNCQGPCNFAPLVAVQPDNIWYGHLTPDAIDEISDKHLAHGGDPVSPWSLKPGERLRQADGALAEPDLPKVDIRHGDVGISGLFLRKAMIEDNALAAFMQISNLGSEEDELIAVDCGLAARVAIHDSTIHLDHVHDHDELHDGEGIPLPLPGSHTVALEPGRLHLMLLDMSEVPDPGSMVNLSLTFKNAGRLNLNPYVHAPL